MATIIARVEAIKDLIQDAVDKGAKSVEEIHKTILDLPISALDERGLLGAGGGKAREAVSQSVGSVYEAIRQINHEIGQMASGILESIEDHEDAQKNIAKSAPSSTKKAGKH